MIKRQGDNIFLINVIFITILGFLIFLSASLGLLAETGSKFTNIAFTQTVFGLIGGTLAFIFTSRIDYDVWRKYSLLIFIISLAVTMLVFVPGVGMTHGGASRWIIIGSFSFQPSEFLKLGYIIYTAAWFSRKKSDPSTLKYGLLPFIIISAIVGAILLSQPDTDNFVVMIISGLAVYFTAGAKFKHIAFIILLGIIGIVFLAYTRPYVMNRINTFINHQEDPLGAGYQIQQSYIAIGSGGLSGRGFGQSIQKFMFLPEPMGDSIFAVASEEFGFIGSSILIFIFTFFLFRGINIANKATDNFGRLLALGIVIIIVSQAFINIAAMIGVLPLTGITLPFVSHGGTALLITLAEAGIIMNISKHKSR